MKWWIEEDSVHLGDRFSVAFYRTLRVPDDGRVYPLPPGLGTFPLIPIQELTDRAPAEWHELGGVVIPMYQREAMWLGFEAADWKPNAVKVGIGRINAISGEPWDTTLHAEPQDYLVCPDQPWLDGINMGDGIIRQFVAMPLGRGYTVEGQLTGEERFGGIQILVVEPKPGRFPDQPPPATGSGLEAFSPLFESPSATMGLAAGAMMRQKIYADHYGVDTWDPTNCGTLVVHVVNSAQYETLVGRVPPPTPIDAKIYTSRGFPWFDLYEEKAISVRGPGQFRDIVSVAGQDTSAASCTADESVDVTEDQIVFLPRQTSQEECP